MMKSGPQGSKTWLALAVRAQGYRSQACQQELLAAEERRADAEREAQRARGEVSDVLVAWHRHRSAGGGSGVLEDGYRHFHAHVDAARERAEQQHGEAARVRSTALDALRASFNRHHALQTLEARSHDALRAERQRVEGRVVGEAWALRRTDPEEGLA